MKKLFIITIVVSISGFSACGQKLKESQVPAAAKAAFQKQYPNTKAGWEKEDANYEVNFRQNGKSMSSVIDKNGTILETETDISVSNLPQSAQAYIKEHYKGAKIKEAAKIVKASGEVNYEALINGKDVMFDRNGNFIKVAKD